MNISIQSLLKGARHARGTVVLIDVFRATSLIVTAFAHNVRSVIPALNASHAKTLAAKKKDALLFGEHLGKKSHGAHYPNSPVHVSTLDIKNKEIILTTMNGTRGILAAKQADEVLIGSFLNAQAVAQYLKDKETVTLVPIGMLYGRFKAIEDELCARTIKDYVIGNSVDFSKTKRRILSAFSVNVRNFFQKSEDVQFCLDVNKHDIVPVYADGKISLKHV